MRKSTLPKIINSFHLKWIALGSMLADHFNLFLYSDLLLAAEKEGQYPKVLWALYDLLAYLGRIAFPLYAFLLVQGFIHTRNPLKYAWRLLLFAFLSEIPFDMATTHCILEFRSNNVFWTLLTGLLLIWSVSWIGKLCGKWKENTGRKFLPGLLYGVGTVLLAVLAVELVSFFSSDYDVAGVITILVMYLLRRHMLLSFGIGTVALAVLCFMPTILFALLVLIPLAMYNGKKGPSIKYFFYGFYPAHLLLLVGIGTLLGTYTLDL